MTGRQPHDLVFGQYGADAAERGHAPDQTEPPSPEARMLFSAIRNLIVLGAVHPTSDGEIRASAAQQACPEATLSTLGQ